MLGKESSGQDDREALAMGAAASEVGEAQTDGAAAAEASRRLKATSIVNCQLMSTALR